MLQMSRQIDNQIQNDLQYGNYLTDYQLAAMPPLTLLAQSILLEHDDTSYSNQFAEYYRGLFNGNNESTACSGNEGSHELVTDLSVHQYKSNIQLPNTLVYHIHMQNILSEHCTVDLSLSDEINRCVQYHARVHHMDFANMTLYSRKQLVRLLASLYNLHRIKPTIN